MTSGKYPTHPVLVIDDEEALLLSVDTVLHLGGINNVVTCSDSKQALPLVRQLHPSLILLDLNMPGLNGEVILAELSREYPAIPVIVLTGRIDAETAVDCMKSGAYDYMVKPVDDSRLITCVTKGLQYSNLQRENQNLRARLNQGGLKNPEIFAPIITCSPKMIALFHYIEAVSITPEPVLITGETGTGKELIARAVHQASSLKGEFVAVNVAGLDDDVFSDTLFGHVRGAYTGADNQRSGLVEKAAGGTLFLDEIGDLSNSSQVKLLRLLQEKEYLPLGLDSTRKSSARIIASTHADLWRLQEEGKFRKDLHYRLRTHHLSLPPLRERKDDLTALTTHFVKNTCKVLNRESPNIPKGLPELLESYHFPGNIRELQALVFDACAQSQDSVLNLAIFRSHIFQQPRESKEAGQNSDQNTSLPTIREATIKLIEEAMQRANQNQTTAAAMLGISQQALSKRLKNMKR